MQSVLLIDDKCEKVNSLGFLLAKHGFYTIKKHSEESIKVIQNEFIDLIILDLDQITDRWFETAKKVRDFSNVPIICLTDEIDKEMIIKAYTYGSDDIIFKPIDEDLFLVKIKAILRREDLRITGKLFFKGLVVDRNTYEVRYDDKLIEMTRKEYSLIVYFLSNHNQVFTREDLISQMWEYKYTDTRTVDSHIRNLREKLRQADFPVDDYLVTVRGFGYKWKVVSN
ncbi:response regulator transcription factor [Metabacillus herbersteinensis]|uniref:Response regulator transcription factor n=1 Tax=Metabacillus herbersteinensis TaxID=283816 RepID=A0ABV6GMH8_9BACI